MYVKVNCHPFWPVSFVKGDDSAEDGDSFSHRAVARILKMPYKCPH